MQSSRRLGPRGLKLNEKSMRPVPRARDRLYVSVRERRSRDPGRSRWPFAQIKIRRLCKFHGVEILPRGINTAAEGGRGRESTTSSSGVRESRLYISLRRRRRAVVFASAECWGSVPEFSDSLDSRF